MAIVALAFKSSSDKHKKCWCIVHYIDLGLIGLQSALLTCFLCVCGLFLDIISWDLLLEHNEQPVKTLSYQAYDIKGTVTQGYIGLKDVMWIGLDNF
jgi:hypothetical protein